jgi:hypothetical protein
VIEQVAEWRAHGLRYIVVANSSGLQRSLRKGGVVDTIREDHARLEEAMTARRIPAG